MTFPTAISSLPAMKGFIGVCFFGALFTAGITSLISIAQAVITGFKDKFNIPHKRAVTFIFVPAFLLSILFITGAGLNILDIVDAFINQVGIAFCGVLEVILIAWFFNPEKIRQMANEYSNFKVGKWWTFSLKIITVAILGIMTIINTKDFIVKGYGNYSQMDINVFGWGSIAIVIIFAIIFTKAKGADGYRDLDKESQKEVN